MELCGSVVQALADFFGIKNLSSTAEFPTEIDAFMALIDKVSF